MAQVQPIAFSALAIAASVSVLTSVSCRESGDGSRSIETAPVVGRYQTVDGVIDLTVDSFADRPGYVRVQTNTVAEVMADVTVQKHPDANARNN